MTAHPPTFQLKVQRVGSMCLFELSWGRGQQLTTTLEWPDTLTHLYQEWRRVYLGFYKTAAIALAPNPAALSQDPMRGRMVESGNVTPPPVDWHARLVEAEARLLYEFHRWLRSVELFEIRARIAQASQTDPTGLCIFLTCTPLELARFPWEAWEVGTEFAASSPIRMVRTPANIRAETAVPSRRRSRARILAILGDDTGLNFEDDRTAVHALSRVADLTFVGWQPGQTVAEVKDQIRAALADERGWDILFFAGHSNETQMTGGELAIAPNVSIRVSEIAPQLTQARDNGLQFAIFNSCSGLSIAETLIDLGLSQVAVMREPVHNRVAQEFLIQFLQGLAAYKDVHESLLMASQFLKFEKNLTYPSAYLIPSLFRHPDSAPFRLQPHGWKQRLKPLIPTRLEAIALAACLTLAVMPSVQNTLLDWRTWTQSVYRDLTGQVPPAETPPVVLVQIDEESIKRSLLLAQLNPISRPYLAQLVEKLADLDAKVIGFDYLLDRPQPDDSVLGEVIQTAVAQHQLWMVFAALYAPDGEVGMSETSAIARPQWSMEGYVESPINQVMLLDADEDCRETCPFAYLLSLIHQANQDYASALPQPTLTSQTSLRTQLNDFIQNTPDQGDTLSFLERSRYSNLSVWAYNTLQQTWMSPIIDFSIPPDRIYERVAAWRVLDSSLDVSHLSQQIVVIGAGGYTEAQGVIMNQRDYHPLPLAVRYWRDRLPPDNAAATFPNGDSANTPTYLPVFTGTEVHAYTIHHLLNQHLVIPVPDLWMVGLAILAGKGSSLWLKHYQQRIKWSKRQRRQFTGLWVGTTASYGLVTCQIYVSAAVVLPWVLPSSIFAVYILPTLMRKSYD